MMATSKPAIEVTTGFGLGLSGIGCANFKLSQPRGSPHKSVPNFVPSGGLLRLVLGVTVSARSRIATALS